MLNVLNPFDPDQSFPDPDTALDEPNGLLAVGGCLSPKRLENAYRSGIFPWFGQKEPILWWSPDPRLVIQPGQVRVSRSLAKRLRRGQFQILFDTAFDAVVEGCASPRPGAKGTWITEEMKSAYHALHERGLAHSFEAWQEGKLVGGLYGVTLGQIFFGESMFHRATDASKAAFAAGCRHLAGWGYRLIDCQVYSSHLASLGALEIPRSEFVQLLAAFQDQPVSEHAWQPLDRSP